MVTSSEDGEVKFWDLEKRREIASIYLDDEVNSVAVSSSGYILALIEGDDRVKIYQLGDGISETSTPTIKRNPLYKNQYAIVVGVDRYRRVSIPKLKSSVHDAKAVAKI